MIEFRIDPSSGVAPYRQIVNQVRQALRLGILVEGDQLPTVKDVVARVAINPNTVLHAYRQLGLYGGRCVWSHALQLYADGELCAVLRGRCALVHGLQLLTDRQFRRHGFENGEPERLSPFGE